MESLLDLWQASAERFGPRVLFLSKSGAGWIETSYREVGERMDALRGGLASLGVGPGDRVGMISNNRVEWAVVAFATYGLGAVLVPMYEAQLERDWIFITRDAGCKVLFVATPRIRQRIASLAAGVATLRHVVLLGNGDGNGNGNGHGAARASDRGSGEGSGEADGGRVELTYDGLLERGAGGSAPRARLAASDVACLLYTSGTTGEPKGVVLSHGNLLSNVLALKTAIPVTDQQRTLSIVPWAHPLGLTVELHTAIAAGASIGIAANVDRIAEDFPEVRPTVLVAVPRVFLRVQAAVEKLLAGKPRIVRWLFARGLRAARQRKQRVRLGLIESLILWIADRLIFAKVRARVGGRLQFAVSGSAALPREVAELIDGIGIAVYEGYGLTECSPIVSANVPGARRLGSTGRPLPGVRVVIDAAGEIIVYGPNVMRGYHDRPEETRAAFTADGGLRTGDLGRLDEDGFLYITGRIKEQYKLANGKYVSPAPLEERLKLSPFIAAAMICGENRSHNVALVVPVADHLIWWAESEGIAERDLGALASDPRVHDKIRSEIDRLSSGWRGYERIAAFTVLPEDFTQANDLLTPSMKLKRRNVAHRWAEEIERLARQADAAERGPVILDRPGSSP